MNILKQNLVFIQINLINLNTYSFKTNSEFLQIPEMKIREMHHKFLSISFFKDQLTQEKYGTSKDLTVTL